MPAVTSAGVMAGGCRADLANCALPKPVLGRAKPDPGKPWRRIRINNPPERQTWLIIFQEQTQLFWWQTQFFPLG